MTIKHLRNPVHGHHSHRSQRATPDPSLCPPAFRTTDAVASCEPRDVRRRHLDETAISLHGGEGSWLIAFASNPSKLPITRFDDVAGLQDALQTLLPGVEVEQIVGWDWVNDPLALGTWCIYRPGQLAQILPDLRTTEGRLFFAGALPARPDRRTVAKEMAAQPQATSHLEENMATTTEYKSTSVTAGSWEPLIVDGRETGEVHWLRGEGERAPTAGLWRIGI